MSRQSRFWRHASSRQSTMASNPGQSSLANSLNMTSAIVTDQATDVDSESSIILSRLPSKQHSRRVTITTKQDISTPPLPPPVADVNEAQLKRLRQSELIGVYHNLHDHVRKLEKQLDLRDDLLRKLQQELNSQKQLMEEREKSFRKKEMAQDTVDAAHEETLEHLAPEAYVHCRYASSGCTYRVASLSYHEDRLCRYRPTRCPSLTCSAHPAFALLLQHVQEEHDGNTKGRDRICRGSSDTLVSSYVNIDQEPIFYKASRTTWVANELVCENKHFFLECMRIPPEWHIWVYIVGSDDEARRFQFTITLFREDEYGVEEEQHRPGGFSTQRSYTGQVVSIHRSKEEIAEQSLGFMVHDKQIRPLCGAIVNHEEQLFGYEVTVFRKQ